MRGKGPGRGAVFLVLACFFFSKGRGEREKREKKRGKLFRSGFLFGRFRRSGRKNQGEGERRFSHHQRKKRKPSHAGLRVPILASASTNEPVMSHWCNMRAWGERRGPRFWGPERVFLKRKKLGPRRGRRAASARAFGLSNSRGRRRRLGADEMQPWGKRSLALGRASRPCPFSG